MFFLAKHYPKPQEEYTSQDHVKIRGRGTMKGRGGRVGLDAGGDTNKESTLPGLIDG